MSYPLSESFATAPAAGYPLRPSVPRCCAN